MGPVRRRVALVTGVSRSSGAGAAIARRLAADGFDLFLQSWSAHDLALPWGDRDDAVELLTGSLGWAGRRVAHLAVNLDAPDAPGRVIAAAVARYGHVDVLVANHVRAAHQSLEQLTTEELDLAYAVNTRATLMLVKAYAAAPDDEIDSGSVVLFMPGQQLPPGLEEIPHISSDGALRQITTSLAAHLAPVGSRSTASAPGWPSRRKPLSWCRGCAATGPGGSLVRSSTPPVTSGLCASRARA